MLRCKLLIFATLVLGLPMSPDATGQEPARASRVEVVRQADGGFVLLRNGEPYEVRGAGVGNGDLGLLVASGGNSVRTWSTEQLDALVDGRKVLDRAHELGISVSAGFWVQHPRHGFDYSDSASIERQRGLLRRAVGKYKDHPALLTWGLGNEMEAFQPDGTDVRIWQELNQQAGIIKELDPDHPVMTVIAGAQPEKIAAIKEHYPNIDILGVNAYGNAGTIGKNLVEMGWDGPYMLTEFGVDGTWEVPETPWGAPIEPDPGTKAAQSYTAYTMDRENNVGRSLGSYVFFWGHKQEATATWFGMFLSTGEKLPRVDAMAYAWSGDWPSNRAPKLESLETPFAFQQVRPGSSSFATVECVDREGDELTYVWDIREESSDRRIGGDDEAVPPSVAGVIQSGQGTPRIEFDAPEKTGGYRVFVTAYDGKGGAVSHNLPFFVEP